jgi:hypothetical protein
MIAIVFFSMDVLDIGAPQEQLAFDAPTPLDLREQLPQILTLCGCRSRHSFEDAENEFQGHLYFHFLDSSE